MPGIITFSPEMEKFRNSGNVARVVRIISVVLRRIEAINKFTDQFQKDKIKCDVNLYHKTLRHKIVDSNILSVEIEGRLEMSTGTEGKESKKTLLGACVVVYEIKYALPKEPIPKEVRGWIKDFADINGIYNAWPYFRARMQDITAEMGIPFVLPTFRIVPKKPSEEPEGKNPQKIASEKSLKEHQV